MPVCILRTHADELRQRCGVQALNLQRRVTTKYVCGLFVGRGKAEDQPTRPGELPRAVEPRAVEARGPPVLSSCRARNIFFPKKTETSVRLRRGIHSCVPFFYVHLSGLSSSHIFAPSRAAHIKSREIMLTPDALPTEGAPKDGPDTRSSSSGENDPLVQYVVVRRDLMTALQWPLGAVVAQACHAAVDALGLAIEQSGEEARKYLAEGSNMRTVVLQASDERELAKLQDKLVQKQIGHKLWREEPEKIPTALASVPIRKSAGRVFKGLKLLS